MVERAVIQVTVPGLSHREEVQVIVRDEIIQNGCFVVKVLWGAGLRMCYMCVTGESGEVV